MPLDINNLPYHRGLDCTWGSTQIPPDYEQVYCHWPSENLPRSMTGVHPRPSHHTCDRCPKFQPTSKPDLPRRTCWFMRLWRQLFGKQT